MREIKFRAWHKKKNKMYQVYRMCFADYQEGVFYYSKPYADGRSINAETGDKDIIIMQFTGLKDKNGKEIFEGDVCREVFQGEYIGEVTFSPTQGYLVANRAIWPHDIEVIGNIYSNPELLQAITPQE